MSMNSLSVGIFYPSGEPISLHLLRCGPIAVDDHSFMGHASHLQQPRLVNNQGKYIIYNCINNNSKIHAKSEEIH